MRRATNGCSPRPPGSSMISRSEKRLTRNGSTDARSSGPPRLKSTMATGSTAGMSGSNGSREHPVAVVRHQVSIEGHANRANEESSRRRHLECLPRHVQEPVVNGTARGLKAVHFRREIGIEVEAEFL